MCSFNILSNLFFLAHHQTTKLFSLNNKQPIAWRSPWTPSSAQRSGHTATQFPLLPVACHVWQSTCQSTITPQIILDIKPNQYKHQTAPQSCKIHTFQFGSTQLLFPSSLFMLLAVPHTRWYKQTFLQHKKQNRYNKGYYYKRVSSSPIRCHWFWGKQILHAREHRVMRWIIWMVLGWDLQNSRDWLVVAIHQKSYHVGNLSPK